MAEPTNEDAAKALERLTNPQAPTPQPKPRPAPTAKPQATKPQPFKPQPAAKAGAAKASAAKAARPAGPPAKAPVVAKKAAPAPVDLQQALAGAHAAPGLRTAPRAKSDPVAFGLALKRTVIPVLLTLGFVLISLGVVHYAWKSDDNPVLELPTGVVIGMLAAGAVLWGLAALNMASVRRTLAARS